MEPKKPEAAQPPAFCQVCAQLLGFAGFGFAPVRPDQQSGANQDTDPAIDRPADLSGHKTAGQEVDPLQEPDAADQNQ